MGQKRKLISPEEQGKAIGMMLRFKDIHEEIDILEAQMERIREKKESLLADLDMARTDDNFFQSQLEASHGPGKLDATTLEWVTKTEENENVDENTRVSEDA